MLDLDLLTRQLKTSLASNPAGAGSFKFVIRGLGAVRAENGEVTNEDAPADCTLSMSEEDLAAVLAGDLDPQAAMMQGRMEVSGDVSVAAAMQPALIGAWMVPDR